MDGRRCNQSVKGQPCEQPQTHRFTWPGRDEALICAEHKEKAESVAAAMGFHLQMIPLDPPKLELADDAEPVSHGIPR